MTEGAEIAHNVSGFSRISPEVFARNRHAGLYSIRIQKDRHHFVDKGALNKGVRKQKISRKNSSKKMNSAFKFGAEGFAPEIPDAYFLRSVNPKPRESHSRKSARVIHHFKPKVHEKMIEADFTASEELMLSKKLKRVLCQADSLAVNMDEQLFDEKEYIIKLKLLNEMIWTSHEVAKRLSKARAIMISNQVFKEKEMVRKEFCRKEWAKNLKRNYLFEHGRSKSIARARNACPPCKKRGTGHSHCPPTLRKNWNIKISKDAPRCRHQVHTDGYRDYVVNYFDHQRMKENGQTRPVTVINAPVKPYLNRNFEFAAMTVEVTEGVARKGSEENGAGEANKPVAEASNKPVFSFSAKAATAASNAKNWFSTAKGAPVSVSKDDTKPPPPSEENSSRMDQNIDMAILGENLEDILTTIVRKEQLKQNHISTPLVSNSKMIISTNEDDGSVSAVSSIPNSSSVHRARVNTTPPSNSSGVPTKDMISLNPTDVPLRTEGLLPKLDTFQQLTAYFEPFMMRLLDLAENSDKEEFNNQDLLVLATFIQCVSQRIQNVLTEDQYSHHLYLEVIDSNVADILNLSQENHARMLIAKSSLTSGWVNRKKNLSRSTFTLADGSKSLFTRVASAGAPSGDGDDSDDDDPKPPSRPSSRIPSSGKKRRSAEKKRRRKEKSSGGGGDGDPSDSDHGEESGDDTTDDEAVELDDETPNDRLYRQILKELMKASKNYKIKELSMASDPSIRREKFNNWVIDIRNILSTHSKTLGLLDEYPTTVPKISFNIDRAVKALLSSVTVGMAKQLVGNADSAMKALHDLKRNYSQTSSFDVHRERKKMMLMRQQQNEKASEFLRRIRKQITVCINVGCTEYYEESTSEANIVNIILGGLDSGNKLYSATIAELKARYRSDPSTLTFVELEELFFNIDDNYYSSSKNNGKKEHANFIVGQNNKQKKDITCHRCGKKGHMVKDCRVKLPSKSENDDKQNKKDMSKIKCFKCGQTGHYANKCSNQPANANVAAKVTFESAHIAKEGDESCKICHELLYEEPSQLDFEIENNFCFKFQNVPSVYNVGGFACVPNRSLLQDMYKKSQKHVFDYSTTTYNQCINRYLQRRTSRNFKHSARVNKNRVTVSEPDYAISNQDFSAGRRDKSVLIEDLETRNLRGQNCRAKSNDFDYFKSYNFINFDHLSDSSYPRHIFFESRARSNDSNNRHCNTEFAQMVTDTDRKTIQNTLPNGDLALWLFDSGATSHFTPVFKDLQQAQKLDKPIYVKVADGSTLRATHRGLVSLTFVSDQGITIDLKLLRVLFVPGLQTRLFSIESFVSDGSNKVVYSGNSIQLQFPQNLTMTLELPHHPPSIFSMTTHSSKYDDADDFTVACIEPQEDEHAHMANEVISPPEPPSFDPIAGGEEAPTWTSNDWEEHKWHLKEKRRMTIEQAHNIFGHRAVSSLLWASRSNVWDDMTLVAGEDVWCDSCKISTAPKHARSKAPLRFTGKPLQHMFIDIVPSPGQMRGVKGYNEPHFLFLCDPISKYADKKNLNEKSTKQTILALTEWRDEMIKKGFELFFYLRSDAGTNFTSDDFKAWCRKERIQFTIAGPKHQEQNAFAETTYRTVSRMARAMLVHAHLPIDFYHFALDYALLILRVLPAKNLVDQEGNPITTYQLIHHLKPRVSRFKVFGCPVVFKRYQPFLDGKMVTDFKQLQQGSRGIFVGFPRGQAGWLIFVPEKIQNSHLVISMDVVFDQEFISSSVGSRKPFAQSQPERDFKLSPAYDETTAESTGDITNLMESSESHWGEKMTFDSKHNVATPEVNELEEERSLDSDDEIESDEDEPVAVKKFEIDLNAGSQQVDGMRRSRRLIRSHAANLMSEPIQQLKNELMLETFEEVEAVFTAVFEAAASEDVPIAPYLPEPKSFREIQLLPEEIKKGWIKAIVKELTFLINNGTFEKGVKPVNGDEIVPSMIVYKAKVTSRGFLDKLKARCVARGDLQFTSDEPETLWSPCVFARTFKMFVAEAVRYNRPINQLDFIGAFCQAILKDRLFVQLPKEYAVLLPEFAEYFTQPLLLRKSIYGLNIAAKVWNEDLTEWLIKNEDIPFHQSEVDPSLYIHRNGKDSIFLIIYVDDCLYFGSSKELEAKFEKKIGERFHLETQGWTHWFLGTRVYREEDGSYILDQESYIKHILNRYCGKESVWGLPPMQKTPAPVDYVYSKDNRPKNEMERQSIASKYKGLSMASAVSSLLYAALNTRPDILWITNKLAKSSCDPGLKDFEALLHVFGYLRCFPDYGLKFYAKIEESPIYEICQRNNVEMTEIMGFSDSSWQDCPDSGRSTCGFKVFVQGGLIDAQSTMPIPVALSSAEAEYMGACNLGSMMCHLRELKYDFEFLGLPDYKLDGTTDAIPSIILTDNQATVRMSKNYKVTSKNRHIGRRWHFVRRGVKNKLFNLKWIPGCDQLADDCTKTQSASKSKSHFERTLFKVPDKVKGFRSDVVGNR